MIIFTSNLPRKEIQWPFPNVIEVKIWLTSWEMSHICFWKLKTVFKNIEESQKKDIMNEIKMVNVWRIKLIRSSGDEVLEREWSGSFKEYWWWKISYFSETLFAEEEFLHHLCSLIFFINNFMHTVFYSHESSMDPVVTCYGVQLNCKEINSTLHLNQQHKKNFQIN